MDVLRRRSRPTVGDMSVAVVVQGIASKYVAAAERLNAAVTGESGERGSRLAGMVSNRGARCLGRQ